MTVSGMVKDAVYIKNGRSYLKINPFNREVATVAIKEIEDLIFDGILFFNREVSSIDEAIALHRRIA